MFIALYECDKIKRNRLAGKDHAWSARVSQVKHLGLELLFRHGVLEQDRLGNFETRARDLTACLALAQKR